MLQGLEQRLDFLMSHVADSVILQDTKLVLWAQKSLIHLSMYK